MRKAQQYAARRSKVEVGADPSGPAPRRTLWSELKRSARQYGRDQVILDDPIVGAFNYRGLIRAAAALGRSIARQTSGAKTVGMLMPTMSAAIITFFALQSTRKVPAMLHAHSGVDVLKSACRISNVRTIITSRAFIEKADLTDLVAQLAERANIIYLEDLRAAISPIDKLVAYLRSQIPNLHFSSKQTHEMAVVLFTSGTTGAPKGVALSHANLLSNIAQVSAHISFAPNWVFFNVLPVSHAFGLLGGALLPIFSGMKAYQYPSPLDRTGAPETIRKSGANILVATDTFAQLYARSAKQGALQQLKYVVIGGERLTEPTLRLFSQKSPAELIQGYGATECSPVIAMNRPAANRPGTVGVLLAGMTMRLDDVPEIASGANLLVRGPNVMLGYLDPDGSGRLHPPEAGWFDTGDIVAVDADGFITIIDRRKRFAKVGGEMVSLDSVEACARSAWPNGHHAALVLSGEGGRDLVTLATDQPAARRADLATWATEHNLPRRSVPEKIVSIDALPLLPTGKPDYPALRALVSRSEAPDQKASKEALAPNGKTVST